MLRLWVLGLRCMTSLFQDHNTMIWLGDVIVPRLDRIVGQQCTIVGPTATDDVVPYISKQY